MKMKMKAKYFAKVKSIPQNTEINVDYQEAEESEPVIDFSCNIFPAIDFAESY